MTRSDPMKIARKWLSAWTILAALPVTCLADDPADLRDRVLKEYPPALARLEAFYSRMRLEGTFSETLINDGKEEPRSVSHYLLARDGESRKIERVIVEPGNRSIPIGNSLASCSGPVYSFRLRKENAAASYKIKDMGAAHDKTILKDLGLVEHYSMFSPICSCNVLNRMIMADPTFRLGEVTEVLDGGQRCLKIEYEVKPDAKYPKIPGWWLVAPDLGWVLIEFDGIFGTHQNIHRHGKIEYGKTVEGIALLKSVMLTHPSYIRSFEVERIEPGPVPASEFTLTAFGLPELDRPESPALMSSPAPWLFGAAALFLALAFVVRSRESRKQTD